MSSRDSEIRPVLSRNAVVVRLVAVGAIVGVAAGAFAAVGGWFTPQRLTPDRIVAALGNRGGNPVGHRRNHSKGICFTGTLEANGEGARYSTAPMLAKGRYPVTGRFAIAVGNPAASDAMGRVKSMAIRVLAGGQEWRSGMNNTPVFIVSTPRAFYELTKAQEIVPATGKPDPTAMGRFLKTHPESAPFATWAKTAPWTASWADQTYDSLNAFALVDATGARHLVRWAMEATTAPNPVPQTSLAALGPDFLNHDLTDRLDKGALRWRLVVTLAASGDPSDDATKAWAADRPKVEVATLIVDRAEPESDGPCRDFNYDPTILPTGIEVSDDPLLAARSAAYAKSFDLRTAEAARYPHTASPNAAPQTETKP